MTETETENASKSSGFLNKDSLIKGIPYAIGVLICAVLAFRIRIRPRDGVFGREGFIRFSENDPWYHWNNLDYLLHNYPHFEWFDPFTTYPYGTSQAFAPLHDFILATLIKFLNLFGIATTTDGAMTIAAYWPCVLAAFCVIAVYFVAKTIFDSRNVGLVSAFLLAVAPGQFLSRSIVGFNDHHVAEVLFSTIVMIFLAKALIASFEKEIRLEDLKAKNFGALKPVLPFAALAGIALALYTLVWEGALLFGFIIGAYVTLQMIVNHLRGKESFLIAITGVVIFAIDLIIVLVTPQIGEYKTLHLIALTMGIVGFTVMSVISSLLLQKKNLTKWAFPGALIALGIIAVVAGSLISTEVYNAVVGVFSFFTRSGGATTIGEAHPFFSSGNYITTILTTFAILAFVAFFAFFPVAYKAFKENRQERILFVVWTLIILWAMLQQTRFSYYFIVNVAILCGWAVFAAADAAGLKELMPAIERARTEKKSDAVSAPKEEEKDAGKQKSKDSVSAKAAAKEKRRADASVPGSMKKGLTGAGVAVIFVLALVFVGLPISGGYYCTYTLTQLYTQDSGGANDEWVDACLWLKENTPDTGLDKYGKYEEPVQDADGDGVADAVSGSGIEFYENRASNTPFNYPDSAYGVISWWDYGHWIEMIGQRMACANPFQFGVGGRRGNVTDPMIPGAAPFFVAESEDEATGYLEAIDPRDGKAGARYVITDIEMASGMSKFYAMTAWTLDTDGYYVQVPTQGGYMNVIGSDRYYNSMVSRLHLFDTNGMKQYRMIYESGTNRSYETVNKQIYNMYHGDTAIDITDTGYVKIYEYVKGAKVTGTAFPNDNVTIRTTVKTNQGRAFTYEQTVRADAAGRYEFTVPYSTTGGPISGQTNFVVAPTGPYRITSANVNATVDVTESDVLYGGTVTV